MSSQTKSETPQTPGKLVVLEGIDGVGKSTHVGFIADCIRRIHGVEVLITREPGGTPLAESIRQMLLHESMDPKTEVLLAVAARHDHVEKAIRPALEKGWWVVCDRFIDSTRAYQGGGGEISLRWIDDLNAMATSGLSPDRVYLFDAPAELAAQRRGVRGQASDRFEAQDIAYFERVRNVYLHQQRFFSEDSILVIDSSRSLAEIQEALEQDIKAL